MSTECQHCVSVKLNQRGSSADAALVRAEEKCLLFFRQKPQKKDENKLSKASDRVQSTTWRVTIQFQASCNKMTPQSPFEAEVERPLGTHSATWRLTDQRPALGSIDAEEPHPSPQVGQLTSSSPLCGQQGGWW